MTLYVCTYAGNPVEIHASTESRAFQAMAYLHLRDEMTFLPTESEARMNLYTITFWTDPEDPDAIVEVQVGAKTEEIALAEARLQHPELSDATVSIALEWEGSK